MGNFDRSRGCFKRHGLCQGRRGDQTVVSDAAHRHVVLSRVHHLFRCQPLDRPLCGLTPPDQLERHCGKGCIGRCAQRECPRVLAGSNRARPHRKPSGRVLHVQRDRPAVTLSHDRHPQASRTAAGNADLRFIGVHREIGCQRLDDYPVRKPDPAAVFQVANHHGDLVRAAGNCQIEGRIGVHEHLRLLAIAPAA